MAFCLNIAHSASVPIAVHLDHATTEHDIDTALTFAERGTAFDSIMVDASHADTDEENLEEVSRRCYLKWISISEDSLSIVSSTHESGDKGWCGRRSRARTFGRRRSGPSSRFRRSIDERCQGRKVHVRVRRDFVGSQYWQPAR